MFRTFARKFLPNKLDWILKRAAKKKSKSVLICWNRGLGDIALGVSAIIHRIRHFLPEAKISILTRENLRDGFHLLPGVDVVVDKRWKRGEPYDLSGVDRSQYDLILEKPSPTDWCRWQRKKFTPRLCWKQEFERPCDLPVGIGVQVVAETNYGLWRNWPLERWHQLFDQLGDVPIFLFGYGAEPKFSHPNIIDLRGKTSLYELMSIIKNRCYGLVLPDSGVLSMAYYLDASFPLRVVSLFADPDHGILKQGVASPNSELIHTPLVGVKRDLSVVSAESVVKQLYMNTASVILAGGQGTRLGFSGPKGLFPVLSKPLFRHLMEKVPSFVPVAVMTSPLNHEKTISYFEQERFKAQFFQQKMVDGFPDGNGGVYECLVESGVLDEWERSGIDTVVISPVDNPLADPADKKLIAHHRKTKADVTIKCVQRVKGETMGALTGRGIIEYFDIVEDHYDYSYMGQVALSTQFIRKAAALDLPYREGRSKRMERLLFDAFVAADKIEFLCYPREICYAPIKGPESVAIAEERLK